MSGEAWFFVALVCGAIAIAVGAALANRSAQRRFEAALAPPVATPRQEPAIRRERPRKAPREKARRPVAALGAPARPFRIALGVPGTPDVTIERCPPEFAGRLIQIPAHVDLAARLSPLLQYAPSLTASPESTAGQDLYLMTLSSTAAQGLGAGGYDLAPAAEAGFQVFVMDQDGIVAQDTLVPDESFQPRSLALALWQVLSILVGQPYLASADRRLKRLADEVAEIRPLLEGGLWSRLDERVVALERVLAALHPFARNRPRSMDDVAAVRDQLQSVEREAQTDLAAIQADILALVRGAMRAGLGDFLGPDIDATAAAERVARLAVPLQQRSLAFLTRGVAAQLLACLPGYQDLARRWVEQIADDAMRESRLADPGNAFLQLINKKIENEARAKLNADDQGRLTGRVNAVRRSVSERRGALIEALEDLHHMLEAQLEAQQRALVLVARLDHTGRVRELYRPA